MSRVQFSESAQNPSEMQFQFMSFLPTTILMKGQILFQTCLDLAIQQDLVGPHQKTHCWIDITMLKWLPFLMIYQYLSFKKHRSSKTLAKWNNTYILNICSLGNKFYQKKRLQSTFFLQIHCFPTSLRFLNYSQVIFEIGFGLINHIASWKMLFLVPPPNNSSFDWCKTKQKKTKK